MLEHLLLNQTLAPTADAVLMVLVDGKIRPGFRYDHRDDTVMELRPDGERPVSPAVTAAVREAVATIAAALQASEDAA